MSQNYGYSEGFTYTTPEVASLLTGTSAQPVLNIQNDADFEIQAMCAFVVSDGDFIAQPLLNMLITDNGSGRQLMNRALPIGLITGDGELPFILPQTRILMANSNLTFTLTNFSGDTYTNVFVSLIGRKLFFADPTQ